MAVEVVYRSSRAPEILWMTKNEADAYDRQLEVAENLATVFRHVLPTMTEDDAENLSIFLSAKRELLAAALKKQPAAILELIAPERAADEQAAEENIVQFANAG